MVISLCFFDNIFHPMVKKGGGEGMYPPCYYMGGYAPGQLDPLRRHSRSGGTFKLARRIQNLFCMARGRPPKREINRPHSNGNGIETLWSTWGLPAPDPRY